MCMSSVERVSWYVYRIHVFAATRLCVCCSINLEKSDIVIVLIQIRSVVDLSLKKHTHVCIAH